MIHRGLALRAASAGLALAVANAAGLGPGGVPPAAAAWAASINVYANDGDGAGRVTSDDGGIDCTVGDGRTTGDCSQTYTYADFVANAYVQMRYTPATGSYVCDPERTGCITSGDYVGFNVDFTRGGSNDAYLAPMFWLKTYKVQVNITGPGTVTSNSAHPACTPVDGNDVCFTYKHFETVTLSAVPDPGQVFTYWSGCGDTTASVCTFQATKSTSFGVLFGRVLLSADVVGNGDVCAVSGGSLCTEGFPGGVKNWVDYGSTLVVEARPATGWRFAHWNSGGPCATQPASCSFKVKEPADLVATFTKVASPTPTAKPASTPRGSSAPASTSPQGTAAAQPGSTGPASAAPGDTPTAAPDDGSVAPGSSIGPRSTVPSDGVGGGPARTGDSAQPADALAPAGGADAGLLLLFGLIGLLVLIMGFLLGRGASSGRARPR